MKKKLNPVDRYVALVCFGVLCISMASMVSKIYNQKAQVMANKELESRQSQIEFNKIKLWRSQHDAQILMMRSILRELKSTPSLARAQ